MEAAGFATSTSYQNGQGATVLNNVCSLLQWGCHLHAPLTRRKAQTALLDAKLWRTATTKEAVSFAFFVNKSQQIFSFTGMKERDEEDDFQTLLILTEIADQ